jgi:hypothetical protein
MTKAWVILREECEKVTQRSLVSTKCGMGPMVQRKASCAKERNSQKEDFG